MLSIMNEIDPCLLLPLCVLYEIQNRIYQHQRLPAKRLTTIASSWPFAQWEIDIIGLLPRSRRQVKFLLVSIDYFIKWVEVEVLSTITIAKIQSFVWKNIICRFGIPRTIISDNGWQFDS